jgi:PAS domain S-box-containing protein
VQRAGTQSCEDLAKRIIGADEVHERQITKELLESKKEFETTLRYLNDGFITLTPSAKIVSANPAAIELFQSTEESLLSTLLLDHFDEKYKKLITEQLAKTEIESTELGEKIPIVLHDKFVLIKFVPVFDPKIRSIIVLISDITNRKLDEMELQQHRLQLEELVQKRTLELEKVNEDLRREIAGRTRIQKKLERADIQWANTFDAISDFVSVHDRDMNFIKVNRALADFLGKKTEELIGKKCFEVMHGMKKPWVNCPHVKAMESGKTVTEEIVDNFLGVPLLVTCSPCRDEKGIIRGTVHIARDISQEKSVKTEREKLISELQDALSKVKLLSGFLPICASCKKIRDDKGYWNQIEEYIRDRSEAEFSHGICPDCVKKLYPDYSKNKKSV